MQAKIFLQAFSEQISSAVDAFQLFHQVSNAGTTPGSALFEINDPHSPFAQCSIGIYQPSIAVQGKGNKFMINALDQRGEIFLQHLRQSLPAIATLQTQTSTCLVGNLPADLSKVALSERLAAINHSYLIRNLLCDIVNAAAVASLPVGIYGCFAYDFIRQFEQIPDHQQDTLQDPDYSFYLATRLFIVNKKTNTTTFVSLIPAAAKQFRVAAQNDVTYMCQTAQQLTIAKYSACKVGELQSDTDFSHYQLKLQKIIQHIQHGDAFQVVVGRMLQAEFSGNPLAVYQKLCAINPSPFMFYLQDAQGVLLGASPELAVRVTNTTGTRKVEIDPIAGTKPRGEAHGKIDPLLEQRYTLALQTNSKELAEHTMLIDLARNDIASIAKPGTTRLEQAFAVEKFSHVQHLVSKVTGELRNEIDAVTAYVATMNMGTLTGAPKSSAMQIINQLETNARGYFGGGFGFITHAGDMETCIVIRAMRFKNNYVYLRAGGGIVADSVVEQEWEETANKMRACGKALEEASYVL